MQEIKKTETFCECYLNWKKENETKLKPLTFRRYTNIAEKHLVPFFANDRIESITDERINQFIRLKEDEDLSVSSIRMCILMLKKVSKKVPLVSFGMQYNESEKRGEAERKKYEIQVLNEKEEKILENYASENFSPLGLAILLSMKMGLRIGEICGVQWADVDDGVLHIRNMVQRILNQGMEQEEKTKLVLVSVKEDREDRFIPIPDMVREKIKRTEHKSEYLCGKRNGKLPDPRTMQWQLKKLCQDLKIENCNFHDLRNTFAVNCLNAGMKIEDLSRLLGHSRVATTAECYCAAVKRKTGDLEDMKRYMG